MNSVSACSSRDGSVNYIELGNGMTASCYSSLNEECRSKWLALLACSDSVSFYHTPQWMESYLHSYRVNEPGMVRFVLLENASAPVALFPIRLLPSGPFSLSTDRIELLWRTDLFIQDIIISQNTPEQCSLMELFFSALNHLSIRWDQVEYPFVAENSNAFALLQQCEYDHVLYHLHDSSYLTLADDSQRPLSFLSSRMRKRLKQWKDKLEANGEITLAIHHEQGALDETFGR